MARGRGRHLQDILTDNRPNSTCNFERNVNVEFGNIIRKMGKKKDCPM
jgi:hypothetical protein